MTDMAVFEVFVFVLAVAAAECVDFVPVDDAVVGVIVLLPKRMDMMNKL